MDDDKEIIVPTSDQKNEKRKKKKRRGKTSTIEDKKPSEEVLPTVGPLLTGEGNKIPRERYPKNINEMNNPEYYNNYNYEPKENIIQDNPQIMPVSRDMRTVGEVLTFKGDEPPEENREENFDENEKKKLRNNMNKYFKRTRVVNDDDYQKEKIKEDDSGEIPSINVNPNEVFVVDEEDGEMDYLPGQKAYELSVFLDSHKFITKNKNFDKQFVDLVKRKIIRFERNLLELFEGENFFILYELQVSEHTDLCLTEVVTLNAVKSVFLAYPSVHLIIFISDEELSNSKKYDNSLINEFAQDKLAKILIYLDLDPNDENRIHAFTSKGLLSRSREFYDEKNKLKELINKPRLRKLFNLVKKEEERNDLLLEYPCSLGIAANPLIYNQFIPEITQDCRCLLITSIYFMNRYQLCFDASKVFAFNEPAALALKIVPPLEGVNGREAFSDLKEESAILSSDEDISLNKKINEIAYEEKDQNNPNTDIPLQYLAFIEDDNDNYNDIVKEFEKGNIDKYEVKRRVINLLKDMFKNFREKDINNIDTSKIMII